MEQNLLLNQRAELEKQLKAELKACRETRRKIGAINLLLGPITEPNGDTQAVAFRGALTKVLENDRREKRVMEAVRGILKASSGTFSARTLVEAINNAGFCSVTERDVSHPLWRLRKLGKIGILRKGSGRRPTVYFKA